MLAVEVINDPAAAAVALEPVRSRIVSQLAEPASAATLATRLGTDLLWASYLIALAARIIREVAALIGRSAELDKRLPTLSIDTAIRFRSAAERAAFSSELTTALTKLTARYHDASAPGGRAHRLVLVAHPLPHKPSKKETS